MSEDKTIQDQAQILAAVDDQLRQTIEIILETGIALNDFEGGPHDHIYQKLNSIVEGYKELDRLAENVTVTVPREVIEYVDEGRNPDLYTRQHADETLKKNQYMKGKLGTMKSFRDVLAEEIKAAYPELSGDVDNIVRKGTAKEVAVKPEWA
ncbi:RNA polymerase II mediator complex subunit [Saitoella coloradoensis]